ncbi:MAG: methyl-accepting chemotaxis protein [Spirochaetota bacterium]
MKLFEGKFNSLKMFLATVVGAIAAIAIIILIVISYNAAYNALERSYINQMNNINDSINFTLKSFFEQQILVAETFAAKNSVRDALLTGDYSKVTRELVTFYKNNIKFYENVFIATAERDPVILAAGAPGAVGIKYRAAGYEKAIDEAMDGKVGLSKPNKSPVTGLPVILIQVPVKYEGKIIGLFGLPLELGKYSYELVKDVKIGDTGYPFVTDFDGLTFAHPDKEQILKLDLSKVEFGQEMLKNPDKTVIRYEWQGKDKMLIAERNKEYGYIVGATMYLSDVSDAARSMAGFMVLFGLIIIAGAVIGIYYIIASRLNPLERLKEIAGSLASGNVTLRYDGKVYNDEVGDMAKAINNTMDNLERLVAEVKVAVSNLTQAVNEIANGNENLSQRTSEQASSLEEIAATIEEATATIKQNAEHASRANQIAERTRDLAKNGNELVNDAVVAINEINASSKRIGEILTLINEISFQTNLLALNAAVEAARAGEQGRGFAVVAGEVRNLAQRSGSAAKEIGELIRDSLDKIDTGTTLVNKSGEALKEIMQSIQELYKTITEIATASDEQKQGIDQINVAVSDLDTMTQQNAALVEETASASEEMANQAQELASMMERFVIREEISEKVYGSKHRELHLHATEAGKKVAVKKVEKLKVKEEKKEAALLEEKKEKGPTNKLLDDGFEEF